MRGDDGGYRTDNCCRDRLFEYDNGKEAVAIGLELQSCNARNMLLRIMRYDQRQYAELSRLRKRRRVSSIVLSFDRSGRSCGESLSRVFGGTGAIPERFLPDYSFVSLNIYDLAEKLDEFHCKELRDVLYLFKCAREGSPFMDWLEKSGRRMSRDAAFVCAAFLGFDVDIDDNEMEVGMCQVVIDYRRRCIEEGKLLGIKLGKKEGLKEGKKEGLKEGEKKGEKKGKKEGLKEGMKIALRVFVANLLSMKYGIQDICRMTKAKESTVQEIILSLQQ